MEFCESDVGGEGAYCGDGESDGGCVAGGEGDVGWGSVGVEVADLDGCSVGEGQDAGGDVVGEVGAVVEGDAVDVLGCGPSQFDPAAGDAVEGGPFFGVVGGVADDDVVDCSVC